MYGLAVAARFGKMTWNRYRHLRGAHAHFTVQGSNLLEIRVTNVGLKWRAGQHYFFRFTGLGLFDTWQSHPFTPITVPAAEGPSELVALAKIRSGQMKHLAQLSLWNKALTTGIWLDGPYGKPLDLASSYDRFLIMCGGSGAWLRPMVEAPF